MAQRRSAQGSVMGQGPLVFHAPDWNAGRLLSVPTLDTSIENTRLTDSYSQSRSPSSNPSPISPGSGGPEPLAVEFGLIPGGDQGFDMTGNTNSLAGISSHITGWEGSGVSCIDPINPTWTGPTGSYPFDPLSEVKADLERLSVTVQSSLGCLEVPQLSELKGLLSQFLPMLESVVQSEFELRVPSSPAESPEDEFSYRCCLCPSSRSQKCSKRGAFKRHVTERHEPEYKYYCSFCPWNTPRRDKVHDHYRKYHGLVGRLTAGKVNSLGVKLPAPPHCGICLEPVNSYAAYFNCFASHCRVSGNNSGVASSNGSRKNSDGSGNGGGSGNRQNGSFNNFGGSGGPSGFSYGNGNGYSGGSSNPYFGQSFGYNNQCSKDVVDLHQHQSSAPRIQDPHDKHTNPCESTNEREISDQVEHCKDHTDHQTQNTDTQKKSPAMPVQHDSLDLSDQPEDRRAHLRGSINGILGKSLPRKSGTTDTRRCRSCGHGIDDCARCKSFGAVADRCHNCADKSCVLQMSRREMPRPADEAESPHFGPPDPKSALALRKSRSLPTYRGDKTRMALKSLPTSHPEGKPGRHLGERDIALQELHSSLAAIARKQGALRMPRVNRWLSDKTATHRASEDGASTGNYIIPRLERFSSDTWRQQTISLERYRYIARFLQGSLRQGDHVFDIPFRIPLDHRLGSQERRKTALLLESAPSATCRLSLRRHSLKGTVHVVVGLLTLHASVAKTQPVAEPVEQDCVDDHGLIPNTLGSPKVDAEICMPYSYNLLSHIVQAVGNWNAGLIDHLSFKSLQASGSVIDDEKNFVVSAFMSTLANIVQGPGYSGSIDLSQLSFL
ncbi:hypothetical protein P168DRAFT_300653 [Aspergillus campestris IBT 28561]|uniref:C2H2-type domain-containing protein n=1 Tax=Aspergillus campestris (strain IBT 28561) TaxID=1392248 RepID=A0A2I1DD99_ASPC2|nr:uncharacterized protein P168DRAFT_300653 [Aspergillus campestris IBT 28561]PKY07841.1 hypothetical protein P168DRAFT_300653 [Aspergillus campestris IBT 28561]